MGVEMLGEMLEGFGKAVAGVLTAAAVITVVSVVGAGVVCVKERPTFEGAAETAAESRGFVVTERARCRPWDEDSTACSVQVRGGPPFVCTCRRRSSGPGFVCRDGVTPLTTP